MQIVTTVTAIDSTFKYEDTYPVEPKLKINCNPKRLYEPKIHVENKISKSKG